MKNIILVALVFIALFLFSVFYFPQNEEWVKVKGELTEITIHRGKWMRTSALIIFRLENGNEQIGSTELIRFPFLGNTKAVGDKITVYYSRDNPMILKTVLGKFLANYGMLVVIILGVIFSLKPFLKKRITTANTIVEP